jgi:glycerol-3-phosphate dehydrogenase
MAAHLFEVDWRTKLPKTVVDREPRVTDLEASAQHGAKQFGGIFSRLAISRMVADRFDGSYADAVFTVEEVEAKAAMLFWEQLKDNQAAERAMDREGVRRPETVWMRRARIVSDMGRTASDNESKTTAARAALEAWVRPPGEVPPEVPAG